jgi:hypothetical protein
MTERQIVAVRNPNDGEPLDVAMEGAATESNQIAMLAALNALLPTAYDQILLEYTADDLTKVTYMNKGAAISTIEMTYRDHKLVNVFKS